MAFISTCVPILRSTSFTNAVISQHARVHPVRKSRAIIRAQGPTKTTVANTPTKEFLDRLKPLGKVRLVGRNEAAIMESIATFDGLFYAKIPSGEYANLVDSSINLDLHLLLSGISGARFETGQSRTASRSTTYIIRILGKDRKTVVLSIFLQWDKDPTDVSTQRIDAWTKLKTDYCGNESSFFF